MPLSASHWWLDTDGQWLLMAGHAIDCRYDGIDAADSQLWSVNKNLKQQIIPPSERLSD